MFSFRKFWCKINKKYFTNASWLIFAVKRFLCKEQRKKVRTHTHIVTILHSPLCSCSNEHFQWLCLLFNEWKIWIASMIFNVLIKMTFYDLNGGTFLIAYPLYLFSLGSIVWIMIRRRRFHKIHFLTSEIVWFFQIFDISMKDPSSYYSEWVPYNHGQSILLITKFMLTTAGNPLKKSVLPFLWFYYKFKLLKFQKSFFTTFRLLKVALKRRFSNENHWWRFHRKCQNIETSQQISRIKFNIRNVL